MRRRSRPQNEACEDEPPEHTLGVCEEGEPEHNDVMRALAAFRYFPGGYLAISSISNTSSASNNLSTPIHVAAG